MSRKEAPRVGLLKAFVAGRIRSREVAEALHVSERHVRRLRHRFEAQGVETAAPEPEEQVAQYERTASRGQRCSAHGVAGMTLEA